MAEKHAWLSAPFQQLSQEVDRLFDELIHRPWGVSRTREPAWSPQLDLYEDAAMFVLEADLPGVHEKDMTVTVENGDLVLRGQRTFERICKGDNFHCRERQSGAFTRRLRLPGSVDQRQIHAEFRDGVLRVILPKIKEERTSQS